MKTTNKLDKPFGPAGVSAGIVLLVVGIFTVYNSLFSIILIVIGAFAGLTSTSTTIDFNKNRVKFSNNLFGIIHLGKWIKLDPKMKIGIKKSKQVWRTSSWSNRTLDIKKEDFRIFLYDFDEKQILPIMKSNSQIEARAELAKLTKKLGLKQI